MCVCVCGVVCGMCVCVCGVCVCVCVYWTNTLCVLLNKDRIFLPSSRKFGSIFAVDPNLNTHVLPSGCFSYKLRNFKLDTSRLAGIISPIERKQRVLDVQLLFHALRECTVAYVWLEIVVCHITPLQNQYPLSEVGHNG